MRAPSVMVGYWKKPEETRRVIEPDGWLHTGDQARIDDGRITITGRIKDIIVTSTGEKIAPVDLETAIVSDPLFEQAMVIGEQRPFLAALVVLNAEEWRRERSRNGIEGDGLPSSHPSPSAASSAAHRRRGERLSGLCHAARRVVDDRALDHRRWPADADPQDQAPRAGAALRQGDRGPLCGPQGFGGARGALMRPRLRKGRAPARRRRPGTIQTVLEENQ